MNDPSDETHEARGFASRLTRYGDPGFASFLRSAFLSAAGLADGSTNRPVIGIGTTESEFNPCHGSAPQLIAAIRRGVAQAGGLPLSFPTISLHESFAYPTSMLLRNLMAMDTEEMLRALPVDAVVLVGGCDKTIPAQIMAAVSADVPALIAPVGPMLSGSDEGERIGACTDCRRLWASWRAGEIDRAKLERSRDRLTPTPGTCMVMGTASTMACIAETLGFVLPGGASIPAVLSERLRFGERTGARAVELARAGEPTPRALVTAASLRNAATVLHAIGGSTNAVVHLAAIAGRAGLPFDLDALTDVLDDWPAWVDGSVIRDLADPVAPGPTIVTLRGNLAPNGAVLKAAAASRRLLRHEGPALVFEGLAARALDLLVEDDELARRRRELVGPPLPERGYARLYAEHVLHADAGCDFDFLVGKSSR